MLYRVLDKLCRWLTHHAFYEIHSTGSYQMQTGICRFLDSFVAGVASLSPQRRASNTHSGAVRVLNDVLNRSRKPAIRPTLYS